MSLKIFQINASYKPAYIYGGPTMSVSKLCEVLSVQPGLDLEVVTTTANGDTELNVVPEKAQRVDGVVVRYFKRFTKDHTHFSPGLLQYLDKQLSQLKQKNKVNSPPTPIVVHIQAWWNLVSILSCQIAKWRNIPVILSPRGMLTGYTMGNRNSASKRIIHNLMGKKLLKYCHFHVTSIQEQADVLNITTPKSITIIPNILNLPGISITQRTNTTIDESLFKLIYVSRIEEKKGMELLFDALSKTNINWNLTLAGSGTEGYVAKLKVLAEDLKLQHRIQWIGQVSNADKFELMANHDLLVLTSYNENFANIVIESLSVGTPVLISEKVGLADYVQEKQLGWICTLEANNIQQTLEQAFEDQNQRKKIREQAASNISNDFNAEKLCAQYIRLYHQVAQP